MQKSYLKWPSELEKNRKKLEVEGSINWFVERIVLPKNDKFMRK